MSEQKSKIVPNTFQTPNILTDDYMRYLTGDEVKCYLVIVRKTFGWLKRTDRIATSVIAAHTGLSDATVTDCMKALVSFGLIARVSENNPRDNYGIEWALQMDDANIDLPSIRQRYDNKKSVNASRGAKARAAKEVGLSHMGGYVAQEGGWVVAQGTQKPLSKATINTSTTTAPPVMPNVFTVYQNNIGMLTSFTADELKDLENTFTELWVIEAIKEAVLSEVRNMKYIKSILNRWKAEGFKSAKTKPPARSGNKTSVQQDLDTLQKWVEEG